MALASTRASSWTLLSKLLSDQQTAAGPLSRSLQVNRHDQLLHVPSGFCSYDQRSTARTRLRPDHSGLQSSQVLLGQLQALRNSRKAGAKQVTATQHRTGRAACSHLLREERAHSQDAEHASKAALCRSITHTCRSMYRRPPEQGPLVWRGAHYGGSLLRLGLGFGGFTQPCWLNTGAFHGVWPCAWSGYRAPADRQ
jgi:hypothetical protein